MKTILIGSFLALTATLALADVAVYNGSRVISTTSSAQTDVRVQKFMQVVDTKGSQMILIGLNVAGGVKSFVVGPAQPVTLTVVEDARGQHKTSTALAQASSVTNPTSGVVTVSSLLQQGVNGSVVIKGTDKVALPRTLLGSASTLTTPSALNFTPASVSALVTVKFTLMLQEGLSRVSNNAGDTLAAAAARLAADLKAKGYADLTPPP